MCPISSHFCCQGDGICFLLSQFQHKGREGEVKGFVQATASLHASLMCPLENYGFCFRKEKKKKKKKIKLSPTPEGKHKTSY